MSAFQIKSLTTQMAMLCLFVTLVLCVQYSQALPTGTIFRNQRMFDDDNASDVANPEFAQPGDSSDLQRNSARLHRTLFLLNTSDLLKKALKGAKELSSDSSATSSIFRSKRETPKQKLVRKLPFPILTIDEEQSSPHFKSNV